MALEELVNKLNSLEKKMSRRIKYMGASIALSLYGIFTNNEPIQITASTMTSYLLISTMYLDEKMEKLRKEIDLRREKIQQYELWKDWLEKGI